MRLSSRAFRLIAALAIAAFPALALAQKAGRPDPDAPAAVPRDADPAASWVVLANSHVTLDVETLRARLDQLFPGEFLPPREHGSFVIEGPVEGAQFLIQSRVAGASGIFMLNSVPAPYTEFSDFDRFIGDRTMRRQARSQRSWLSIDLVAAHATEEEAYRFIGPALAALAPADAAFLVHPTRRIVVAFDDVVRGRLARGEQRP